MGTNLGNRLKNLKLAIEFISAEEGVAVQTVSPVYETEPLGGPMQDPFLNACALLKTTLPPDALLSIMLKIEDKMGRIREEKWGPRLIDLDLLAYENAMINTPALELPHPRMAERDFVLIPLFDIAPDLLISGLDKTVRDILSARKPSPDVKLFLPSGWHEQS